MKQNIRKRTFSATNTPNLFNSSRSNKQTTYSSPKLNIIRDINEFINVRFQHKVLVKRISDNIILYNFNCRITKGKELDEVKNLKKTFPDEILIKWPLEVIIPGHEKFRVVTNEKIIECLFNLIQTLKKSHEENTANSDDLTSSENSIEQQFLKEIQNGFEFVKRDLSDYTNNNSKNKFRIIEKAIIDAQNKLNEIKQLNRSASSIIATQQQALKDHKEQMNQNAQYLLKVMLVFKNKIKNFIESYQVDDFDIENKSVEEIYSKFKELLNQSNESNETIDCKQS